MSSHILSTITQVTRELIETSINSGSTIIVIGVDFDRFCIRISDNGEGISYPEMDQIGQIKSISNFSSYQLTHFNRNQIRTYILDLICSICDLEITSSNGNIVLSKVIKDGKVVSIKATKKKGQKGTEYYINNLFLNCDLCRSCCNISSEKLKLRRWINTFALVYPIIEFSLFDYEKGITILKTKKSNSMKDAFINLFGSSIPDHSLCPIQGKSGDFQLSGFISRIDCGIMTADLQFFYVNNQLIENSQINYMINSLFMNCSSRLFLKKKLFPYYCFQLSHSNIRLLNEHEISEIIGNSCLINFIKSTVTDNLHTNSSLLQNIKFISKEKSNYQLQSKSPSINPLLVKGIYGKSCLNNRSQYEHVQHTFNFNINFSIVHPHTYFNSDDHFSSRASSSEIKMKDKNPLNITREMIGEMKVIGQLDRKYIIAHLRNMLICVDQHAADERILLEELYENINFHFKKAEINQKLILSDHEISIIGNNINNLNTWGFNFVQEKASNIISLQNVPIVCGEIVSIEDFKEYLSLLNNKNSYMLPPAIDRILKSKSCRSAVKFNTSLTNDQCTMIIHNLSKCNRPFYCAHGRTTLAVLIELPSITSNF